MNSQSKNADKNTVAPDYHQARHIIPLIFELSGTKKKRLFPEIKWDHCDIPKRLARTKPLELPQLSELDVIRHYTKLSQMNYGVDTGFYPLGSCTMKYNPKICEEIASLPQIENVHPFQDEKTVQGSLQIMYELQNALCEIGGVDAVSLQPSAGAHGEFTGMLIVNAYHKYNCEKRKEIILPDTAHGTNPASAAMLGFDIIEIPSNNGQVDIEALKSSLSKNTAALTLTNPNTLGIFEEKIVEISELVHEKGALLYYDGANLNGMMGKARPGDLGFDIVHFNLHKTFATPHGGGGPGAGPIGAKSKLEKFLPIPSIEFKDGGYYLEYNHPHSVGKVKSFYGNFGVLVKAYVYLKIMGGDGLKEASEIAVLNSNYMKEKLKKYYDVPFNGLRKHEFVLSGARLKEKGIRTIDVAKRLLDYGFHAPTIYFPLLIDEALMIEPTETESKEEIDGFIDALIKIQSEDPSIVKSAPYNTSVGKVDEVGAAKELILTWKMMKNKSNSI